MARPMELLLGVAATALAIVFFTSVPYWPKEWTERPVPEATPRPLLGPSVLASLAPAPGVPRLSLPEDLATIVQRIGPGNETGLISSAAMTTTFRLKASGDLVALSAPPELDPVRRPQTDIAGLRVRGSYAVATVERGATVLRWTEGRITYQLSSRTLDEVRLVELANKLR